VHVGELGESLRQFVRLGLGEAVVGGVEVVVYSVGVGAVLNGNKVVVGGGEVCDACVVAALLRGGFFDANFSKRMRGGVERGSRLLNRGAVWKGRNQGGESVSRSSPAIECGRGQKER